MKLGEITMDSVGSCEILSHISPLMLFTHSELKWSKSASSCLAFGHRWSNQVYVVQLHINVRLLQNTI